jgi:hypothetical protein
VAEIDVTTPVFNLSLTKVAVVCPKYQQRRHAIAASYTSLRFDIRCAASKYVAELRFG